MAASLAVSLVKTNFGNCVPSLSLARKVSTLSLPPLAATAAPSIIGIDNQTLATDKTMACDTVHHV